ncbi:MAG TPA: MFS transporter [Solirubrobacteraceae bacterium]|nr:MFS transporter [Solirubrobacteraceae bacterium]
MNRTRPFRSDALVLAGVVLVAINLRPAAASIGPLIVRIEHDTGLTSGWASALTTLPVLCFGLLAPLAPVFAKRFGVRSSIAAAMVALLAGIAMRLLPGVAFLFLGTAIAGSAIATGNVLLPVLVRRDLHGQTATAMAFYSTALIGFAALAAGVTVPLADALGGGWKGGLGIWAVPAAVGALAWSPWLWRRDHGSASAPAPENPVARERVPVRALLARPLAWQVTLFFALQSGGFYATLAWLPSIYESHGAGQAHAGLLLSLTMVVGLVTAVTVPGLAHRFADQRPLMAASCVLTAAGLAGVLLAPMSVPYLWTVLLGLGQNAAFPLALMLIVGRAGDVPHTEALSTMTQSIGYVLGALGPLAVGAIHGATGSWTPSLILLLAIVAPQLVLGLAASRDRVLVPRGGVEAELEPVPGVG